MIDFNGLWYPNGADQVVVKPGQEQNDAFWNEWKLAIVNTFGRK